MGETNHTLYNYVTRRAQKLGQNTLSGLIPKQPTGTPKWFFSGNDCHWRLSGSPTDQLETDHKLEPQNYPPADVPTQPPQPTQPTQPITESKGAQ